MSVTEINNLACSECGKLIRHADLEDALVKLLPLGVALICEECVGVSKPAVVLVRVK